MCLLICLTTSSHMSGQLLTFAWATVSSREILMPIIDSDSKKQSILRMYLLCFGSIALKSTYSRTLFFPSWNEEHTDIYISPLCPGPWYLGTFCLVARGWKRSNVFSFCCHLLVPSPPLGNTQVPRDSSFFLWLVLGVGKLLEEMRAVVVLRQFLNVSKRTPASVRWDSEMRRNQSFQLRQLPV